MATREPQVFSNLCYQHAYTKMQVGIGLLLSGIPNVVIQSGCFVCGLTSRLSVGRYQKVFSLKNLFYYMPTSFVGNFHNAWLLICKPLCFNHPSLSNLVAKMLFRTPDYGYSTSPPNLPPSTIHTSTSLYAFSKSSFTTTLSCTPSFENAISASACLSRFCTASSLSVPRPRRRCSRMGKEGGERKRKRA